MALANSVALKLAGVNKDTKDVLGGMIVRDAKPASRQAYWKDAAEDLRDRVVPPKTFRGKHVAALAATAGHAAQVGVTSVTDMSAGEDVGLYQYMVERGEMKNRMYAIRSIVRTDGKDLAFAASGSDAAHRRVEGIFRRQPRLVYRAVL